MRFLRRRICLMLMPVFVACTPSPSPQDTASEALQKGFEGLTLAEYQGKNLFEGLCVICHGEGGRGDGFNAYNINPQPSDLVSVLPGRSDEEILKVISLGTAGIGRSPLCPPRKGQLTSEEERILLLYLRRLTKPGP